MTMNNSSALDTLLELGDNFVRENAHKKIIEDDSHFPAQGHGILYRIKDVPFTKNDLSEYVLKSAGKIGENETVYRGLYSGMLLETINRREDEKGGEPFELTINLDYKEYSHLFAHARKSRNLTIIGAEGSELCKCVGAHGGRAENTILIDCGDFAGILMGSYGGLAKNTFIAKCSGQCTGHFMGSYSGLAHNTIFAQLNDSAVAWWMGSYGGSAIKTFIVDVGEDVFTPEWEIKRHPLRTLCRDPNAPITELNPYKICELGNPSEGKGVFSRFFLSKEDKKLSNLVNTISKIDYSASPEEIKKSIKKAWSLT